VREDGPALTIFAHPDDGDILAGGTIARWTRDGREVHYLVLTNGSKGSVDPDTSPAELVKTRRLEQRAAAAVLGVHDVRFLDFEDGELENTPDVRREVARVIRILRPVTVVCGDPSLWYIEGRYYNHRDHRMAAQIAMDALFPGAGNPHYFPELLADGLEPWDVPEVLLASSPAPNHLEDISGLLDAKLEAVACHASQFDGPMLDFFREWIPQQASERGKAIGVEHAEAFHWLRLREPPEGEQPAA